MKFFSMMFIFFPLLLLFGLIFFLVCNCSFYSFKNFTPQNEHIMKKLNQPANKIQPNQIIVKQIDNDWISLFLIEIKSRDEDQSQKWSNQQHRNLELVCWSHWPQSIYLWQEVAQLNRTQDNSLNQKMVNQESMSTAK